MCSIAQLMVEICFTEAVKETIDAISVCENPISNSEGLYDDDSFYSYSIIIA